MSVLPGDMSERQFQNVVVRLARAAGWKVYHTHDSRRSAPGFPDLCMVRERVVFAELKTNTGRVSAAQRDWEKALRDAGAEVWIWRPDDMPIIERTLAKRGEQQ